ncbi:MAG: hypothetical protein Q4E05_01565 [Pseudoclavibacter sp.]|nr:hypothetical protein [Pseudoclavibacter sp.]
MTDASSLLPPALQLGRALRGELVKVRSTRTLAVSLAATTVIALATVGSLAGMVRSRADESWPIQDAWGAYGLVLTAIPVLLAWAAHLFLGELGNGLLRSSCIAVPRRGTVFLAKGVLAATVCAASVTVLFPACHAVFAAVLDRPQALAYVVTPAGLSILARLAFVTACWGTISVGVAAVTRRSALSIGLIAGLYLFVESYLFSAPSASWLVYVLPFASGKAVVPELSDVVVDHPALAALGQLGTTIAVTVLAWWTTVRRDVP